MRARSTSPPRVRAPRHASVVAALVLSLGCDDRRSPPPADSATGCTDAGPLAITYGAPDPVRLPLLGGQVIAVARVDLGPACSGVVIARRWALTAAHCVARPGAVYLGVDPRSADVPIDVAMVHRHPFLDVAALELATDAREALPALEPVPIVPFALPPLVGESAEAAGYGQREDGESGARRFLTAPIVEVIGEEIVIDGGERGTCSGDSGGPLFVLGAGGVRVAGILSAGDPSCAGRSRFARLDVIRPWVEALAGPTPFDEPACGTVDERGECRGATAVRCRDGALRFETCAAGRACMMDADGARCAAACR